MSFIQFESGREKDRIRQDIREARDKLLQKAEADFERRKEFDIQKQLRGDDQWINPAVERKLKENSSELSTSKSHKKKSKKEKHKKHKKEKKSKKKRHSSEDEEYSTSASEDEWVEKSTVRTSKKNTPPPAALPQKRDDWMSSADFGSSISLFSKEKINKKIEPRADLNTYDPKTNSRELNPHWKQSGTGLPSTTGSSSSSTSKTGGLNKSMFKKPKNNYSDDDDDFYNNKKYSSYQKPSSSSQNWKKLEHRTKDQTMKTIRSTEIDSDSSASSKHSKSPSPSPPPPQSTDPPPSKPAQQDFLTDQQMNELGAKLIKAEIMGNTELSTELKAKLDKAREYRENHKKEMLSKAKSSNNHQNSRNKSNDNNDKSENILLTETNSMGMSRPIKKNTTTKPSASYVSSTEQWGGRRGAKNNKKSKSQSSFSLDGERLRYFPDDDKYDIKTMFENEKYTTANDQDRLFVEATASGAGKRNDDDDDFADIFMDKLSRKRHQTDDEHDQRAKQQAIEQHKRIEKSLESCDKCFDSNKFEKQLIIAMGTNVYLTLPWHEGIQPGHCLIIPQSHVTCATQLDEDVWLEVQQFQQALVNMFRSRGQDCVFFETARYLNRRPHCVIQCVPSRDFEMAPFYFKKAIQESEREWSTNKQLVVLKEKSLRQSIPKGLPYFWVQCGREIGFAHVIEEQERFPPNFAQEILAGILNLDARVYRRPRKEQQSIAKVKQFSDWWKPFDITTNEHV